MQGQSHSTATEGTARNFVQRFLYRQLMYYVILKSLVAAMHGGAVGWNKFERTGTVKAGA